MKIVKCPNCGAETTIDKLERDYENGSVYCDKCEEQYVDEQVRLIELMLE